MNNVRFLKPGSYNHLSAGKSVSISHGLIRSNKTYMQCEKKQLTGLKLKNRGSLYRFFFIINNYT